MKQLLLFISFSYIAVNQSSAQDWHITGNAGTTPGTHFIGTTDARLLMFKVNNQKSGFIDFDGMKANTSFGYETLKSVKSSYNAAFGYHALYSLTTGNSNTALGYQALINNISGSNNTATGSLALYRNLDGSGNTANGSGALFSNTSGWYNTAVGSSVMSYNTSGNDNTALGYISLNANTTGSGNIAIGSETLISNTEGYSNVAVGVRALYYNKTCSNLVALGDSALLNNGTGATLATHASGNTALGSKAMYTNTTGYYNFGAGCFSLYSNTTGYANTATGYQSLYSNTTGYRNTATGQLALFRNTTGVRNTAIGAQALFSNTTGNANSALGNAALYSNSNGYNNSALGYYVLYYNTTGALNSALGYMSLYNNTTGNYNTAIGSQALQTNSTGYSNTAVGAIAGIYYTNNTYCTFLGYDANLNTAVTADFTNSMALGNSSRIDASNQVRIGNTSITSIGGYQNWSNISDGRFKKNINENVPGLKFINLLKPITYNLNVDELSKFLGEDNRHEADKALASEQGGQRTQQQEQKEVAAQSRKAKAAVVNTGFIAQQVEAAAKKIGYDFSGVDKPENEKGVYALRYAEFVVPLVKAVQELSQENEELKNQNVLQQQLNKELANRLARLEAKMNIASNNHQQPSNNLSPAALLQNVPNPVSRTTTIGYTIPQQFVTAKIVVTDKQGKVLKEVLLSTGKGSVNMDVSALASGTYQYTLYIDNKPIDSKSMIVAK